MIIGKSMQIIIMEGGKWHYQNITIIRIYIL